ncbi:MAG: hypothetical protein ACN2B6_01125 [Rickettsiales bacterium]
MNINLGSAEVGGEFKVILKNSNGDITKETPWNDNLLTDYFFTLKTNATYAYVGTGNTPPSFSDTKLAALIGSYGSSIITGSASISGDAALGFTLTTPTRVFSWPLGAIVANISEFGITPTPDTSTYLLSVRSLIKDANGNPTTISVTASDQLEIWWRLKKRAVPQSELTSVTGQYVLNGVATDVITKGLNPSALNEAGKFHLSQIPAIYSSIVTRTVVTDNVATQEVLNAPAGSDLSSSNYITQEQSANPSPVQTNPTPGVAKFTYSCNFGLTSGANAPMKCIVCDLKTSFTNNPDSNNRIIFALTFSPEFIKGTDKILSVTFSYTVTRAP